MKEKIQVNFGLAGKVVTGRLGTATQLGQSTCRTAVKPEICSVTLWLRLLLLMIVLDSGARLPMVA